VRKFYSPYGSLRLFEGHQSVALHYFVVDRKEPVAPYNEIVLGYDHLPEEQKALSEVAIRELFTEGEFIAFRNYMEQGHGEDIRTGMLIAPVNILKPGNELGLGLTRPFSQHEESGASGFFRLSEQIDWKLPFRVWGFYTIPQSR
jgi:hypothetical protein